MQFLLGIYPYKDRRYFWILTWDFDVEDFKKLEYKSILLYGVESFF